MRRVSRLFGVCVFLFSLSPYSYAACRTVDLGGVWRVFAVTGSASFQGYSRGTFVFSPTGVLNPRSSSLVTANVPISFARGIARITASCAVTGNLVSNLGTTLSLVDGQLDRNKTVIAGVYRDSRGDVGLVNLVKR